MLLLVLFGGLAGVRAQERYIDSLKSLARQRHIPDTTRVKLYNRVFFNYIFVNMDSAYVYGNLTRDLARKLKDRQAEATYLNHLGVLHRIEGDYATSVQRLTESLAINEEIGYALGMANNYINLGLVYATQDNYPKALEYYQRCLAIKQQTGEKKGIANAWKDMGDIYARMGDRTMAIRCYESAVDERAYPAITGRAWLAEANLLLEDQRISEASDFTHRAVRLLKEHDKYTLCAALNTQGKIYLAMQETALAKEAFADALTYAQQFRNLPEETAACRNLATVNHLLGDDGRAYAFAMKCNLLTDSMHRTENAAKMLRMQHSFEIREREGQVRDLRQQQRLQEAEFERQQIQARGLMAGIALAICLVGVLWFFLGMQNRARREITVQRDRLSRINAEMEAQHEAIQQFNLSLERKITERTAELTRTVGDLRAYNQDLQQFSHIVSHNLRAPIASILGLIPLLEATAAQPTDENRAFLRYLGDSARKLDEVVRDLNEILNTTTAGKNREMVSLQEVMTSVEQQLAVEIQEKNATLSVDFQRAPLLYSVRGYVESILYNLVSNSLKYQRPEVHPVVEVSSYPDGSQICINVCDNGTGIDFSDHSLEELMNLADGKDHPQHVRGIGLYLIRIQTEALGGTIKVESSPGEGTAFHVWLPES